MGIVGLLIPFGKAIDLFVAYLFYNSHSLSHRPFSHHPYAFMIYRFGQIPVFLLGFIALVLLILSFRKEKWHCFRLPSIFILLTIMIGSLLIINVLFKGLWRRPRPVQTEEFGGFAPFHPFYLPLTLKTPEPCRSFPSGHTAAGFCFFVLVVLGNRLNKRPLKIAGYSLTLTLGGALAFVRLAQGGHYFTDIVVSVVITWYTVLILDYILYVRFFNGKRIDQKTT